MRIKSSFHQPNYAFVSKNERLFATLSDNLISRGGRQVGTFFHLSTRIKVEIRNRKLIKAVR
jgi:hypothetical protein